MRDKLLKAVDCALASLNFSTTISMAVPESLEDETGESRRTVLLLSPMHDRLSHKCFSTATIAAMERPIEHAAC